MIAKFTLEPIMKIFYIAPKYLGLEAELVLSTNDAGRRIFNGEEVIVVTASHQKSMLVHEEAGVYLVGDGDIGLYQAFLSLAVIYFVVMMVSVFCIRVPAKGWAPDGYVPPKVEEEKREMKHSTNSESIFEKIVSNLNITPTQANVEVNRAFYIPQFYQLWLILCLNTTAGIAVISVAKTMMDEIFASSFPELVSYEFTSMYVLMISVFNLCGRFAWASASDYLGRKLTFTIFFVTETLLYISIPFTAQSISSDPSTVWLYTFYGATMVIFTMYGGGFSIIPAYLADVFGTDFVGAIHGRLLTAWSTAGVLGPQVLSFLRNSEVEKAINGLVESVNATMFENKFGMGVDKLETLIKSKTVSINALLEILPEDTVDPTPGLYNSTMYFMAGLLFVALILNLCMKPVDEKYHIKKEPEPENEMKILIES